MFFQEYQLEQAQLHNEYLHIIIIQNYVYIYRDVYTECSDPEKIFSAL